MLPYALSYGYYYDVLTSLHTVQYFRISNFEYYLEIVVVFSWYTIHSKAKLDSKLEDLG